jgi:hypothetical protein
MPLLVSVPSALVLRFPHLREDLLARAATDPEFESLCNDYCSVVASLEEVVNTTNQQHHDLLVLKSSLEVEVLERLHRRA